MAVRVYSYGSASSPLESAVVKESDVSEIKQAYKRATDEINDADTTVEIKRKMPPVKSSHSSLLLVCSKSGVSLGRTSQDGWVSCTTYDEDRGVWVVYGSDQTDTSEGAIFDVGLQFINFDRLIDSYESLDVFLEAEFAEGDGEKWLDFVERE